MNFLTTNEPRLDTVYNVDNRVDINAIIKKFNVSLYRMISQMNKIIQIVKIKILAYFQFSLKVSGHFVETSRSCEKMRINDWNCYKRPFSSPDWKNYF